MTRHALVLTIFVAFIVRAAVSGEGLPQAEAPPVMPGVRVHSPTAWEGPLVVEVPVGQLASPGLVDWSSVRLVAESWP